MAKKKPAATYKSLFREQYAIPFQVDRTETGRWVVSSLSLLGQSKDGVTMNPVAVEAASRQAAITGFFRALAEYQAIILADETASVPAASEAPDHG